MPTKTAFKEMTWPSIEDRAQKCNIAIIPFGSMEPQPSHLPVGADTYVIEGLVQRGAALVADEVGAVVLPAFDFGSATGPSITPEALNLPWDVLMDMLVAIFADLYRQGFRRFVLVNGHGSTGTIQPPTQRLGDPPKDDGKPRMGGEGYSYQTAFGFAYDSAAQFVENGPDAEFFFVSAGGFFRGALPAAQTSWWQGGGEGDLPLPVKTSILMALHPELVDMRHAPTNDPAALTSKYRFLGDPRYGVGAAFNPDQFTVSNAPSSQLDDVSAEVGEQLIKIWADKFAAVLREMQAKKDLPGRYKADAYKLGQPPDIDSQEL